ncbi:MAG: serine/threonine protein kinase [Myxococcales bacterium]|nr:serine/threonine protein kinase [Myxococcales bacterium]MCB9644274.1 serine/threonine protein kinase [Myxococcales bacterium]
MAMICSACGRRYADGTYYCTVDHTQLTPTDDPYLGHVVGRYRLLKQIGKGGFGVVYLASHTELEGNYAAVKILRKKFVSDEQLVGRFRREAQVCSQINHENVVQIYDFGFDDALGFFYIMEYLDGVSLSELMRAYPNGMPIPRLLPILRQICSALQRAHSLMVVHRDLKPSNILLIKRFEQEDIVKILDFGIAKVLQGEGGENMTVTGQIVGSPRFMSPEQARGRHSEVDPRSDLYSLGVMVFWLLTGRLPFESKQLARLLYMHVKKDPPTLSSMGRPFSTQMEALVQSSLAKEKDARPANASDFYHLFEAAAQYEKMPSGAWDAVGAYDAKMTPAPMYAAASASYSYDQSNDITDTPSSMSYPPTHPPVDQSNSFQSPPASPDFAGGAFDDDDEVSHTVVETADIPEDPAGSDNNLDTMLISRGESEKVRNAWAQQNEAQNHSGRHSSLIAQSKITPLPPLPPNTGRPSVAPAPAPAAAPHVASSWKTLLWALLLGILLGGMGLLGWQWYQRSQKAPSGSGMLQQPQEPSRSFEQRPA